MVKATSARPGAERSSPRRAGIAIPGRTRQGKPWFACTCIPVDFLVRWLSCPQPAACPGVAGLVSLVVTGEEMTKTHLPHICTILAISEEGRGLGRSPKFPFALG